MRDRPQPIQVRIHANVNDLDTDPMRGGDDVDRRSATIEVPHHLAGDRARIRAHAVIRNAVVSAENADARRLGTWCK